MLEALRKLNTAALLTLLSGNLEEALENQLQYKVIDPEHLRDKYNSEYQMCIFWFRNFEFEETS